MQGFLDRDRGTTKESVSVALASQPPDTSTYTIGGTRRGVLLTLGGTFGL